VLLKTILGGLALLSFALTLWQWLVALRFPLHRKTNVPTTAPGVTLLKPLKGCDTLTKECLKSWFAQSYSGQVQILLAVAAADDPVCEVVGELLKEFPAADAQLVICESLRGTNLKVAKLLAVEERAKHEILVISDADVKVSPDFLTQAVAPLEDPTVGLANCFYRLANPTTVAMQWEAVAINADFWSQVLQSQSLRPLEFALGAVMVTRRSELRAIGGFAALAECLADDYELGRRIAGCGKKIIVVPFVVECWCEPMTWGQVWKHQLRWARTIRVCQPAPYFSSILSNASLWPLLWVCIAPSAMVLAVGAGCWVFRTLTALHLQRRLTQSHFHWRHFWLVPVKDLLQAAVWAMAFAGNTIEWRGERMHLRRDGTLVKA
jgi:ceramide glucosyltransferase